MLACAVLACLLAGPAVAADDPAKPPMVCPSFCKTSQLYELCTIQHQTDCVHCEGSITGVVSALQNEQIRRARACIPKGALYRIRKTHCAGETGKKTQPGASNRGRTGTLPLGKAADFKSAVSTNFTIEAECELSQVEPPRRPASVKERPIQMKQPRQQTVLLQ
jgi:hypothetical protein